MDKLKVLDLFSGYTIREDGLVTSRFGRTIKSQLSKNGYYRIELWNNGIGKKYLVHRLLADAFISNPENKPQVNHIDGNPSNNSIDNLEWVTQSENQLHAYKTGLQKGYKISGLKISENHKKAFCGSRWRGEKRIYFANGKSFDCPKKAADFSGVSRQTFYNRVRSTKYPSWQIQIIKEVENNDS